MQSDNQNLNEKIIIDFAVVCQEFTNIEITCDSNNIITLDEIEITKKDFCNIFYPNNEKFGINKTLDKYYHPFISLQAEHRTSDGKKFNLLESILKNLEYDLNISRNCFTTASRIELANEFSNIKSLSDINACSVLASLTWSNLLDILNNYHVNNMSVSPIFCISIIFKTPTPGARETIIKLNYKFSDEI